jgi:hypothetical protein
MVVEGVRRQRNGSQQEHGQGRTACANKQRYSGQQPHSTIYREVA